MMKNSFYIIIINQHLIQGLIPYNHIKLYYYLTYFSYLMRSFMLMIIYLLLFIHLDFYYILIYIFNY